jgi:hypothetical protein
MSNDKTISPGPEQYGTGYWCIKVPASVSKNHEIYVFADEIKVTPSGDLLALGGYRKEHGATPAHPLTVLALATGKWTAFYAASCIDGAAVAVQHWPGEVER